MPSATTVTAPPATPFTVDTPGATLRGDVSGGGPAVVLLHAGICDRSMWDGEVAALVAAGYRAVRFDSRGAGASEQVAVDGGVPFAWHDDVAAVLGHLGIARAAIVGCSFGARVALDLALAAPDRVAALVLVSARPSGSPADPLADATEAEVDAAIDDGDLDRANELELRLWVDGPAPRATPVDPALRKSVGRMNRAALARTVETGWYGQGTVPITPPASERLPEVSVPTLVVLGERDLPSYHDAAERLSQGIASSELLRVPDAAHLPTMERPDVFLPALRAFLDHHVPSHPPR